MLKTFPTSAVLSVYTGIMLCKIDGVYEVCSFMTGESVFTHQIPRVINEARPVILALHPQLEPTIEEAKQITQENVLTWLATWEARYGETLTVPKMTIAEHERIDPLSELAEKVSPDKIVVV